MSASNIARTHIYHVQENSGEDGAEQWLTSFGDKLDGFSWRGGGERDTNGILLWRHPFIVRRADGTKVRVIAHVYAHTLSAASGAFDGHAGRVRQSIDGQGLCDGVRTVHNAQ
jgi:hypothetical protein